MRKRGLFLALLCGLLAVGVYRSLAQTGSDSAARFTENAMKLRENILFKVEPNNLKTDPFAEPGDNYPWHSAIVTTVFWIGESPTANNPVPNQSSAWDSNWSRSFGGSDAPGLNERKGFIPAGFIPRQNPFYLALPYNDVSGGCTKSEAYKVVPWLQQTFTRSGQSVLKGRWVAIRKGIRICFGQWEDVGPFRSDHWQYVFGNDRPRPNLNRGAGLDVSPAIRDYLNLGNTDVTDWRFVDFEEVPPGPWTLYGDNNSFVIDRRKREEAFAKRQ
jgi:hypothetical protein